MPVWSSVHKTVSSAILTIAVRTLYVLPERNSMAVLTLIKKCLNAFADVQKIQHSFIQIAVVVQGKVSKFPVGLFIQLDFAPDHAIRIAPPLDRLVVRIAKIRDPAFHTLRIARHARAAPVMNDLVAEADPAIL